MTGHTLAEILVWTAARRTHLAKHPEEVEPGGAIAAATAAMTELVRVRMRQFGSAGQTESG